MCAEAFEREARAAAAAAAPPDRDAEVLQKLLTVKDQMIWRVAKRRKRSRDLADDACSCADAARACALACARSLVEERDALRAGAAATAAEVGALRQALGELRRNSAAAAAAH